MKNFLVVFMFVIGFFGMMFGIVYCLCHEEVIECDIEVNVLCVNQNILNGNMIGQFLGSSGGSLANDVNKIGVEYSLAGTSGYLDDFKVKHAILAYYKNDKTLIFNCKIKKIINTVRILFYINGNWIETISFNRAFGKKVWSYYDKKIEKEKK